MIKQQPHTLLPRPSALTGTYDWQGNLDMQPNPFTLWGITGVPAHTRHRALLSAASGTPSGSQCTETSGAASSSNQTQPACWPLSSAVSRRSALSAPARVRASSGGALPVQGRVSVREQQFGGGSSSTQGAGAVVPGTSSIIDEGITAVVPGVPAQLSTPAVTPPAPTGSPPLSPVLIACVSVGVFVAALFTIIMLRRRRNSTDQPLPQALPMQFDVYTIQPQRPAEVLRHQSGRVCTPRDVNPYTVSDVSFTEVQQLSAGETSFDSSWGGRAMLPPARDSDPG